LGNTEDDLDTTLHGLLGPECNYLTDR